MAYQELKEELRKIIKGKTVILGIGNLSKGDDAAGSLLIERIKKYSGFTYINCEEIPESYTGDIIKEKPDTLIIIDSVNVSSEPGDIFILNPEQLQDSCLNAHRIPLKVLILYLSNYITADIYIIGIQPKVVTLTNVVSEEVLKSVSILEKIFKDLSELIKLE